jgi:hypothetical protein
MTYEYPAPEDFTRSTFTRIGTQIRDRKLLPPYHVVTALSAAADWLYVLECTRKKKYASSKPIDQHSYQLVEKAIDEFFFSVIDNLRIAALQTYDDFFAYAEETKSADGIYTQPLLDLLDKPGRSIQQIIQSFYSEEYQPYDLFSELRLLLDQNLASATETSKTEVLPSEHKGTPQEIAEAYLKNTPLHLFLQVPIPFSVPERVRFEHTVIVAGSGWGKTQLLQSLILQDLDKPDPPSLIILDSTGNMIRRLQQLEFFNTRLKDRLLIIDPAYSPAINMFDVSNPRYQTYSADMREDVETEVVALFNYIFSAADYELTSQMGTAFSYAVRLILSREHSTLEDLRVLLEENPSTISQSAFYSDIQQLGRTAYDFFERHFFSNAFKGTRAQIARRLHNLIGIPAFRRMFTASNNAIDLFEHMQKGTIVLVNTNLQLLKEDGYVLFGRYLIAKTLAAAFERATIAEDERRPAFLIIDEAAPYFDPTFEKLLTRVRQFKLGVVLAFQHLEQAPDKLKAALAANTSIKFAGRMGYRDRTWMAHEMNCSPDYIQELQKDAVDPPQWTQYACHVLSKTDAAVTLTLPFFTLENCPKMGAEQLAALIAENNKKLAGVPRPETKPAERPLQSDQPMLDKAELRDTRPAAPPDRASTPSNDPHTGDHAKPADRWGAE